MLRYEANKPSTTQGQGQNQPRAPATQAQDADKRKPKEVSPQKYLNSEGFVGYARNVIVHYRSYRPNCGELDAVRLLHNYLPEMGSVVLYALVLNAHHMRYYLGKDLEDLLRMEDTLFY